MTLDQIVREYQRAAAESISANWRAGRNRVVLQSPTGSGKTLTSAYMIEKAVRRGKRVLFLAHRRRLIEQVAKTLKRFGIAYGIVMASLPDDAKGAAWAVVDPAAPVQIASRDTLLSRMENPNWRPPKADLLFIDEAHTVEAENYIKLVRSCGIKYWVGLTATPVRPDGSGLGRANFDAIVVAATVADLVAQGHLVPVKCFAPPGTEKARKEGGKARIAGDPVSHWKTYAAGLSTVVFCPTIAGAAAVAERYRAAGVPAEAISSHTKQHERDAIYERVESGETLVLTNAFLLVEGVDIPRLACCQILRKCGSFVNFMQAVGRVMRPWECPLTGAKKEHGILLDHSGAIFEHGFPDEPVAWELAEDDNLHERLERAKKAGERKSPVCCTKCGALFAGSPACPACGEPLRRAEKKVPVKTDRERLVQLNGRPDAGLKSNMQAAWTRILYQCGRKGHTLAAAASRFHALFGAYPGKAGVTPAAPFDDRYVKVAEYYPQYGGES